MKKIQISQPVVGEAEFNSLKGPLESGWLTQGPEVAEFENSFARYHQSQHALAVTSCTTGLHLILYALGIGEGDEVVVPAFSWVASANVVEMLGAKPIFVDVCEDTYNIDASKLEAAVNDNTKAVIIVHLFGLCADMDTIRQSLPEGLPIIEDAACAAGALYNEQYAGTLGLAASFSFHPRKIITTGEGGMVTTQDDDFATQLNVLRNHGASVSEEQRHKGPKPFLLPTFEVMGFNYRMTDLQGAVGVQQMKRLDGLVAQRRQYAEMYMEALADVDWLKLPLVPSNCVHSWQSFVTLFNQDCVGVSRNQVMESLEAMGIATRPGTHAIHSLGYYANKYSLTPDDFPVAQRLNDQTMAIPLHNRMSEQDIYHVVDCLEKAVA